MTSYTERCVYDRGWGWWSYPRPTGSGWHALICHAGLTHIIHWGVFVEEFLSSAWKTVKAHMLNEHKLRCKYSQTWHLHGYEVAQVVPSQDAFKFNMVGNINLTCALHSSVMPCTVSFTHIHGVKKKKLTQVCYDQKLQNITVSNSFSMHISNRLLNRWDKWRFSDQRPKGLCVSLCF